MKHSIRFLFDSKYKKSENARLNMVVTYSGNRVLFSTGINVPTKRWNAKKMTLNSGSSVEEARQAYDVNNRLARMKKDIEAILLKWEKKGSIPRPENLRNDYNVTRNPNGNKTQSPSTKLSVPRSLLQIFDEFVEKKGFERNWTPATYEKFTALGKHIIKFKAKPTFDDFNESGLGKYVKYLMVDAKMKNSTIKKNLGFLKWFLRWANKKGYHNVTDFETFDPKLESPHNKPIYLEPEELKALWNLEFDKSQKNLEQVRDVFVFCCFCGIRFSDVKNLRRENILNGQIELTTIKTSDRITIPLNEITAFILKKYEDYPTQNNKALPVISNQKMNDELKTIAKMAGITNPVPRTEIIGHQRIDSYPPKYKLIGTHAARRTFVILGLSMGIQPQVIMDWTGHSSYKAMKPYIDILDNAREKSMQCYNSFLSVK